MRGLRCSTAVLVIGLLLAAVTGWPAEEEIAFETITLQHLTAGEIAWLLGESFRFVAKEPATAPEPPPSSASGPRYHAEGVELVTAGSPTSRCLLVAGTPHGVAELRTIVSLLDAPPVSVPVTITVYPSLPNAETGWRRFPVGLGEEGGSVIMYAATAERLGQRPSFPAGVEATEIKLTASSRVPELIPLPAYGGFPQVILCLVADADRDGAALLSLSFGGLGKSYDLLTAVREARYSSAANLAAKPGEEFAVIVPRGDRAITLLVRLDKPQPR